MFLRTSSLIRVRPAAARFARWSSTVGDSSETPSKAKTSLPEAVENKFGASTSKLLHLLSHSLYKDPSVFLRELVSNASDALEKLRHHRVAGLVPEGSDADLGITVEVDEDSKTIKIRDNGIGMSPQSMADHLGTIARSGTKEFVESASESANDASSEAAPLIGQFGVGFYSAFVVADKVKVVSKQTEDDAPYVWESEAGSDSYVLRPLSSEELEAVEDGKSKDASYTEITLKLNDQAGKAFATERAVEDALTKYSNYVNFPISLGDRVVNTTKAIWTRPKSEITEQEYTEFYRFCADAFDEPKQTLHFRLDVPIDISALLFVPGTHEEKRGMGRTEPGVALYSKRVLLASGKDAQLLPNYLRFIKGVVDSSDLPMAVSRDNVLDTVDSALVNKISSTLTKKILRSLAQLAKKDPDAYKAVWDEFGHFLKEGVANDFIHQKEIAKLLRYDSSRPEATAGDKTSLDEYVSRMPPWQKNIYYLNAPNRELALASPYYEAFKEKKVEVLFVYHPLDDFVFGNLQNYEGRDLVGAEGGAVESDVVGDATTDTKEEEQQKKTDDEKDAADLAPVVAALGDRVQSVTFSRRPLGDSPSLVVDHESAGLRKMMLVLQQETGDAAPPLGKQKLELNRGHPLVTSLLAKSPDEASFRLLSTFLLDSALVNAGLVDDVRGVWPNIVAMLSENSK